MGSNAKFFSFDTNQADLSTHLLTDMDRPIEISQKAGRPIFTVFDSQGAIVKDIHRWLSYLGNAIGTSVSKGTVEQYGRTMSYLVRWIESERLYPNLMVEEILSILNRGDIAAWIHSMTAEGLSLSTIHSRETCVKSFLEWLSSIDGGCKRLPMDSPYGKAEAPLKYISRSPSPKSPKFINADQVIQLLLAFHNECERCMFHTQYDTGLRIGEIIQLRRKDLPKVERYSSTAMFIPLYVQGLKGRANRPKQRITLISRATLNRIKRYHSTLEYKLAPDWEMSDPNKPVFLTANQLGWQARNANKQFRGALQRSRLEQSFVTHWMRHGTAFSVLRSDIGRSYEDRILAVQQMLGHSRLSTTEIYTQIAPSLLTDLTKKGGEINRLDEAEEIRAATFLPSLAHKERRGHK